jgi:hypothetical protein
MLPTYELGKQKEISIWKPGSFLNSSPGIPGFQIPHDLRYPLPARRGG